MFCGFSKRFLTTWSGRMLMTLGLVFVGLRLWDFRHSLLSQFANPTALLTALVLAFIYTGSSLLLATGWWLVLTGWEKRPLPLKWKGTWPIYGKTQIAKYIPGNIFHIAGRHALAARHGASHPLLVAAATIEIVMMLLAAGLISMLAIEDLVHVIGPATLHPGRFEWVGGGCIALVTVVVSWRRSAIRRRFAEVRWPALVAAQLSYFLFFTISAALFFALISITTGNLPQSVLHWRLIVGGYTLAWAIGFLVPGAPGGLGVREAVLVALLSWVIQETAVLAAAVLFRLVTVLGDVLFFLNATIFGQQSRLANQTR